MSWTERPPGMPLGAWLRAHAQPAPVAEGPRCDVCGSLKWGAAFNALAGQMQCGICRDGWTEDELAGRPAAGRPTDLGTVPANGYGRDVLDWLAAR